MCRLQNIFKDLLLFQLFVCSIEKVRGKGLPDYILELKVLWHFSKTADDFEMKLLVNSDLNHNNVEFLITGLHKREVSFSKNV